MPGMSGQFLVRDSYRLRNAIMKKFIALFLSILAFDLILMPQLVEAEMTALTDKQMEKRYLLSIWSLRLMAYPEIESKTETESYDLFDHCLTESSTGNSQEFEHFSHRWQHMNAAGVLSGCGNAQGEVISRDLDVHRR